MWADSDRPDSNLRCPRICSRESEARLAAKKLPQTSLFRQNVEKAVFFVTPDSPDPQSCAIFFDPNDLGSLKSFEKVPESAFVCGPSKSVYQTKCLDDGALAQKAFCRGSDNGLPCVLRSLPQNAVAIRMRPLDKLASEWSGWLVRLVGEAVSSPRSSCTF